MTDKDNNGALEVDENRLIAERREKLRKLREHGEAFPNDFRVTVTAAELNERFADGERWDQSALEGIEEPFSLSGRIMSRRVMGKASFVHIQDGSGERIQLYLRRDDLPEGVYRDFKQWDIGDIVGVSGRVMRTRTGELSLHASELCLLTKSLRPLPEKWHGLSDQETRYRQRYVDLIVNPDVRETFVRRSLIVRSIRRYFDSRGFLEVETPMMHHIPGGATARPFVTHHNALDLDLYLRVAPELHLKRLLVGGLGKVYEINRNFRNEGVSTRHNPEFTMLEYYWANADYNDLIALTQDLLNTVVSELPGMSDGRVSFQGETIDFSSQYDRVRVADAVIDHYEEVEPADIKNADRLRSVCRSHDIHVDDNWGWGRLLMELFEAGIEQTLIQPTFVVDYPIEVSPLSRRNDEDPDFADRFELIVAGREIANGFSELNDPEDQAERFRDQVEARDAGDAEAMHFDHDYIRALEYGMPPAAGEGIGIDRLVMLLTDSPSIRDVLLFPYLRPESDSAG
ncbi:lysine--tRNA ligase [Wenzhouxiangella sp. AB-CW3]|uniref:lysine--tRNA ligase n=1 Tax=Wenzhouxiangella sp. AB-CW3 TaxID=2771012 RepID=UPI00168A6E38|nr:lysine--tRNA ligase [Wenzhouxiangella sp. AB-CW3]QOC21172.1 lysine--tRNA ligase [Wenzhouxiangella sp. AB-CW3]